MSTVEQQQRRLYRKGWDKLKPSTRETYRRAGIDKATYESGRPITGGHTFEEPPAPRERHVPRRLPSDCWPGKP